MTFPEPNREHTMMERLGATIRANALHHAYILEGPANMDKEHFAKKFAQAILCQKDPGRGCGICSTCRKIQSDNHMDVTILRPTAAAGSKTKSIRDEDIQTMQRRLRNKPYDGERNIAIVVGSDTVTLRAFNRLLKTLEEPPVGTVIMLLTDNISILPQTIRSRAVHLRLQEGQVAENQSAVSAGKDFKEMLDEGAPYYKMKQWIETASSGKEGSRDHVVAILDHMEGQYAEELRRPMDRAYKEWIYSMIRATETAKREIRENRNMNYTLKNMILTIAGGQR